MTPKKQKKRDKEYWIKQLEPIAKDLRLGQRRVQKVGVARWLFDFAYKDIEALSAGQLIDIGFEVLALVAPNDLKTMDERELLYANTTAYYFMLPESVDIQKLVQLAKDVQAGKVSDDETVGKIVNPIYHPAHPHVPAWIILEFHKLLREKFEGMFAGRYWKHERPAEVIWLLPPGIRPKGNAYYAQSLENPAMQLQPVAKLMLIAGDAVFSEQRKFGVCARCGKPFMAEKNSQRKHCSETCAIYLRVNRHRLKKRRRGRR